MAIPEPLAEGGTGCLGGILADQRIQQPRLGGFLRLLAHRLAAHIAGQTDRFLHQIADDRFHVAADIANLGELGRFHLHERGLSQLCETTMKDSLKPTPVRVTTPMTMPTVAAAAPTARAYLAPSRRPAAVSRSDSDRKSPRLNSSH